MLFRDEISYMFILARIEVKKRFFETSFPENEMTYIKIKVKSKVALQTINVAVSLKKKWLKINSK